MGSMGGCNDHFHNAKKAQGAKRLTPGTFSRNNLAKGGVNTDLGGGAPSKVKTSAGTSMKGKAMTGKSKA